MSLRNHRSHQEIRNSYVNAALVRKEQKRPELTTQFQRNQAEVNTPSENHLSSKTQCDKNNHQSAMLLEDQLSSSSTVVDSTDDQGSNTSNIDDELVYQIGAAPNDLSIMAFAMEEHALNFSPNH